MYIQCNEYTDNHQIIWKNEEAFELDNETQICGVEDYL